MKSTICLLVGTFMLVGCVASGVHNFLVPPTIIDSKNGELKQSLPPNLIKKVDKENILWVVPNRFGGIPDMDLDEAINHFSCSTIQARFGANSGGLLVSYRHKDTGEIGEVTITLSPMYAIKDATCIEVQIDFNDTKNHEMLSFRNYREMRITRDMYEKSFTDRQIVGQEYMLCKPEIVRENIPVDEVMRKSNEQKTRQLERSQTR